MKTNSCRYMGWLPLLIVLVLSTSVEAWVVDNTSSYASDSNSLPWVAEQINGGSLDNAVTFSVTGDFPQVTFTGQCVQMTAELGQQSFSYLTFNRGVELCGVDAYSVWLGSVEHDPGNTPVEVEGCRFRGYLDYVGAGAIICSNEFSGARLQNVDLNTTFTDNRFAGSSGLYFGNAMSSFQDNTFSNCTIDLGSDNMVIDSAFDGDCHLVLHQDNVLAQSCTASGELSLDIGDEFEGGNEVYAPGGDYILGDVLIQGASNHFEGFAVENYSFSCTGDYSTVHSNDFLQGSHTPEISGGNNLLEANVFYNENIQVKGVGNTLLNNTFFDSGASIQATGNDHRFEGNVFLDVEHPLQISGDSNTVLGCWFGSDPDGTEGLCGDGIQVSGIGTVIGGSNAQARNYFVLSDGSEAIELTEGARHTRIENNWFGLDGNTNRLGCHTAIKLSKTDGIDILDNVFVATCYGVRNSYFANDITIQGNYFGTGPGGNEVIPATYTYGNALWLDTCSNIVIGGTTVSDRNVFGNLAVDYPIQIEDSREVNFCGNYIGLGADGQTALPNKGHGLYAYRSTNVVVGGTNAASRNVIGNSTNNHAVYLWLCTQVTVMGNYIGLCADGQTPAPVHGYGIRISSSADVRVGGPREGEGNIVAACGSEAIRISADAYATNVIWGNRVGFAVDGITVISNEACGIYVSNDDGAGQNLIVGGTNSADGLYRAGNLVAGSGEEGLFLRICHNALVEGNQIGVDITGTNTPGNDGYGLMVQGGGGNTIRGNLIVGSRKSGMLMNYSPENIIEGNWLGVSSNGQAMGNAWHGIEIMDDSYSNLLGGATAEAGNWIANNASNQVYVDGDTWNTNWIGGAGLVMQGNKIGGGAGGAAVRLQKVGKNGGGKVVIGGPGAQRNVLPKGLTGIHLVDVHNLTLGGNDIGFDPATDDIADNLEYGILLEECSSIDIGSTEAGGGNSVGACQLAGIKVDASEGITIQVATIGCAENVWGETITNAGNGIIVNNSTNIVVGVAGTTNFISGNEVGVDVMSSSNVSITANQIGYTPGWWTITSNRSDGIRIEQSEDVAVGGSDIAFAGLNIIAGCGGDGIEVSESKNVQILANWIGVDYTATNAEPNLGHGLLIRNSTNILVGTVSNANSVISGNVSNGIHVVGGDAALPIVIQRAAVGVCMNGMTAIPNGGCGIVLENTSSNQLGCGTPDVGNLISGNTSSGVLITGTNASGNLVRGNMIGTDITGAQALPNGGCGVLIVDAPANEVGGLSEGDGNVIAGNGSDGVRVCNSAAPYDSAIENRIAGNMVGIGTQTNAVPNQDNGVCVSNATFVYIQRGNMIGANGSDGVEVWGMASHDNFIQGNLIGGEGLGNGEHGVYLHGGDCNRVGSTNYNVDANEISYNGGHGVFVATGIRNPILCNAIYKSGMMGINLGTNGMMPNDPGDADTGPNQYQNCPVLTNVFMGSTHIYGDFNSAPDQDYRLEFFFTETTNASGYGEGHYLLSWQDVHTDASGDATFYAYSPYTAPEWTIVTATATDTNGNTSEFSDYLYVAAAPDTDSDTMPNLWEDASTNLDSTVWNDPTHDSDGDGTADGDEYIADTDPDDPDSFLYVDIQHEEGGDLKFNTSEGRQYPVEYSTNLPENAWIYLDTIDGTGGEVVIPVDEILDAPAAALRIQAEIP